MKNYLTNKLNEKITAKEIVQSHFLNLFYGIDNSKYYLLDNYYRLYCAYLTDDETETDYFLVNLEYLGLDYINIICTYESEQATLSQLEHCISEALIMYNKHNKHNKLNDIDWQKEYWENDECLYRDIDFDFEDSDFNGDFDGNLNYTCDVSLLGRYQIVFEYDNQKYYCFIDAPNLHTALGMFFRNHSNLSYDNIIDHLEI